MRLIFSPHGISGSIHGASLAGMWDIGYPNLEQIRLLLHVANKFIHFARSTTAGPLEIREMLLLEHGSLPANMIVATIGRFGGSFDSLPTGPVIGPNHTASPQVTNWGEVLLHLSSLSPASTREFDCV
jgi:hypothetical protein